MYNCVLLWLLDKQWQQAARLKWEWLFWREREREIGPSRDTQLWRDRESRREWETDRQRESGGWDRETWGPLRQQRQHVNEKPQCHWAHQSGQPSGKSKASTICFTFPLFSHLGQPALSSSSLALARETKPLFIGAAKFMSHLSLSAWLGLVLNFLTSSLFSIVKKSAEFMDFIDIWVQVGLWFDLFAELRERWRWRCVQRYFKTRSCMKSIDLKVP